MEPFRQNLFIGDLSFTEILQNYSGPLELKYRQLMDIATKRGNHFKKQQALGKLLKNALTEADNLWISKIENFHHL